MWLRLLSLMAPRRAELQTDLGQDPTEQANRQGAIDAVRVTDDGRGERAAATFLADPRIDADEVLLDRLSGRVDRARKPGHDVRDRLVDAVDTRQDRVAARENAPSAAVDRLSRVQNRVALAPNRVHGRVD